MDTDTDRVDEAVQALLWLNLDATGMAWKSFDWGSMERLHERGLISSPVSWAKSIRVTEKGPLEAKRLFLNLFTRSGAAHE